MAEIVKGADVAAKLKENITERQAKLRSNGRDAKLTILSVGDDPANASYERGIIKVFTALDIPHEKVVLEAGCSQDEFDSAFTKINEDPTVTGILVFRPLPKPLSVEFAAKTIDPKEVREQYFKAYQEVIACEEKLKSLLKKGGYIE